MTLRNAVKIVFLAACGLSLVASAQQAVPLDREPSHHLALENEYVRVFKVEVAPHAGTLLHQHDRDYIFVTLGPSSVENDVLGKPAVKLQLQNGEARFAKGGFAHVARNLAETPFRNLTVELLKDGDNVVPCDHTKDACGLQTGTNCRRVLGTDAKGNFKEWTICAHSYQVLKGRNLEVRRTDIFPGVGLRKHSHIGPHLAIAITDLDLRSVDAAGKSKEIHQHAGDISWIPGGLTHTLSNVGKDPASLVTIEFKQ